MNLNTKNKLVYLDNAATSFRPKFFYVFLRLEGVYIQLAIVTALAHSGGVCNGEHHILVFMIFSAGVA